MQERHFHVVGDNGYYQGRHDRAKARLDAGRSPENCWFFGIAGLDRLEDSSFVTPEEESAGWMLRLQQVDEPPDFVEVLRATASERSVSLAGTWSQYLRHELVARFPESSDIPERCEKTKDFARAVVTLIRARSSAELMVPVASNYSWSTIAGVPEGQCQIIGMEQYPLARGFGDDPKDPTPEELEWIAKYLARFYEMSVRDQRFGIAATALADHPFQSTYRVSAAVLWIGIEALLNPTGKGKVMYEISKNGSALLATAPAERATCKKLIERLYGIRKGIVHGDPVEPDKVLKHCVKVGDLLAQLIIRIVEMGSMPDNGDFKRMLAAAE